MTTPPQTRTERDSMGPMQVPADALYGASTMPRRTQLPHQQPPLPPPLHPRPRPNQTIRRPRQSVPPPPRPTHRQRQSSPPPKKSSTAN